MAQLETLCGVDADRPPDQILAAIVDSTAAALDADTCLLGLWDPARGEAVMRAYADRRPTRERHVSVGQTGRDVAARRSTIVFDQTRDAPRLDHEFIRAGALLAAPICSGRETLGELIVTGADAAAFEPQHERILRLFAAAAGTQLAAARRAAEDRSTIAMLEQTVPDRVPSDCAVTQDLAHDLKSPLGSLLGLLALALRQIDGRPPDRQRALLEHAQAAAERLRDTLERLTDRPAREDAERLSTRPTILADVVATVLARVRDTAAGRGISLEQEVAETLPRVSADPFQLGRVFENLVDNAIKFSQPGGQVSVRASVVGDRVECAVVDEGRGIPAWALARVFERHFRVPEPRATTDGTGLGLAICRRIIEQHGGRIWAESRAGRGTTIRFTLPLAR